MKIKYLEVKQRSVTFYLCVINVNVLNKICSVTMRDIQNGKDIFQRSLNDKRVKDIANFVLRDEGYMPPSIILNSRDKLVFENDYLIIDEKKDGFFVVDGQHRIAGAHKANLADYEFPVCIFECLDVDKQSELFVSINSEQKKVSPNIRFRIKASADVYNPEKAITNLCFYLNEMEESPFYQLIKMDDSSYNNRHATISISSFADILLLYFYNPDDYFTLKDFLSEKGCVHKIDGAFNDCHKYDNRILWKFYALDKMDVLIRILYNYFTVLKKVFKNTWGNPYFMVTKTTGINAIMLLFKDVFVYCRSHGNNYKKGFMYDLLMPLEQLDGKITIENFGLGKAGAVALYKNMVSLISLKGVNFEELDYSLLTEIDENIEWDD